MIERATDNQPTEHKIESPWQLKSPAGFTRFCRKFGGDERGATAIIIGFSMFALIGFAAAGMDTAIWYQQKRDLQSVADLAALSAGEEMVDLLEAAAEANDEEVTDVTPEESDITALKAYGKLAANRNGFNGDASRNDIAVYWPPGQAADADEVTGGDEQYLNVEVVVAQDAQLLFSGLFLNDTRIASRALAGVDIDLPPGCIIALSPDENAALYFTGSATVQSDCPADSLSADDCSLRIWNSQADIDIDSFRIHDEGGYCLHRNQIRDNPDLEASISSSNSLNDPFADLEATFDEAGFYTGLAALPCADLASDGSLTYTEGANNGSAVGEADGRVRVCRAANITSNTTLPSGNTYFFDNGDNSLVSDGGAADLKITSGDFSSDGSTIVMTDIAGGGLDAGGVDMSGGTIIMNAPGGEVLEFPSIALMEDPNNETVYPSANKINGNSTSEVNGVIYFPTNNLEWLGTSDLDSSACLMIIANTVTFSGNDNINISRDQQACDDLGIDIQTTLVLTNVLLKE